MKSMQGLLIETIKEVPWNLELFFENFIEIFTQKSLWHEGTKLQIIENGPREGLSSIFQLMPSGSSNTQVKIGFMERGSVLEVFYDMNMEIVMPNMPFGKKMMKKMIESQRGVIEKTMENLLKPLITVSIREALKKTEDDRYSDIPESKVDSSTVQDPLKLLKLKFVEGEISEEEYLRKKKILEE